VLEESAEADGEDHLVGGVSFTGEGSNPGDVTMAGADAENGFWRERRQPRRRCRWAEWSASVMVAPTWRDFSQILRGRLSKSHSDWVGKNQFF